MIQLQLAKLVHFVCIEQDKWDIDPRLILEGTMYNLTFVRVFSTPNLGVFDEKVCTHVFTSLTHSVRLVTTADIPCVLGSDTGCMIQVIYEWKAYFLDW